MYLCYTYIFSYHIILRYYINFNIFIYTGICQNYINFFLCKRSGSERKEIFFINIILIYLYIRIVLILFFVLYHFFYHVLDIFLYSVVL